MNLFYTKEIDGDRAYLDPVESRHCIKVLRFRQGQEINFTDGLGGWYKGTIEEPDPEKCVIFINERTNDPGKRLYYLHIAIAPTKQLEKFEWFLEKATEIGVDEITPIFSEKSERIHIKTERFNKILVGAMKQSLQTLLPKFNEPKRYKEIIGKNDPDVLKFIAHCDPQFEKLPLFAQDLKRKKIFILIGPEGDFSSNEIFEGYNAGFKGISLGKTRLRTETAGIVACNVVSVFNQFENH